MKKLYTFIGLSGLLLGVNAQGLDRSNLKPLPAKVNLSSAKKISSNNYHQAKAAGDIIYSNTMDDASQWLISAPDVQGQWEYFTTPTAPDAAAYQYFGGSQMGSTTASDGFFGFENLDHLLAGDFQLQNGMLELDTNFDFSLLPTLEVSFFQQNNFKFNQDEQYIEFSTDGGNTWPNSILINGGVGSNDEMPNDVSRNISSLVGGESSVRVRFRWTVPTTNGGYGWYVDDLVFTELGLDVNLDAQTAIWSFSDDGTGLIPYTHVPLTQASSMHSYLITENIGTISATNSVADITVSGSGTYSGQTGLITMAAGDVDTLVDMTGFTPSSLGVHNILMSASSDENDSDLSNNSQSISFEVTDSLYARDNGTLDGWYGSDDDDGDGLVDPVSFQQDFEINALDTVYGLSAVFPDVQDWEEMEIYYNIYDGAGNPLFDGTTTPVPVKTIYPADLSPSDGSANNWVYFPFGTAGEPGVEVDPANGNTFTVEIYHDIDSLFLASSGTAYVSPGNWVTAGITFNGLVAQTGYYITNNLMIRMNMKKPPLGVDVNEEVANIALGQNMPNPTAGTTVIPFSLVNSSEVEFMVTDITGKVIEYTNLGNRVSGNHNIEFDGANLADGVYYYSIIANGNKVTSKMSIAK